MPKRSLVILVLGVVIALGTAMSLSNRVSNSKAPATELSQVLVATVDIPAGAFVRAETQLAMMDWPKNNITENMMTNLNSKPTDFSGAVARRAIMKGEPIQRAMLVKSSEGGFMSAVLEPGKRAVSIAVDSTSGNAGFIFPGDKVDLILTHAVTKQSFQSRASETFVENVRVLAVDQMTDNPENKAVLAKTVTLEVSPKQAEEINLAKDLGKISLSLRSLANKTEDVATTVPVVDSATVDGVPSPEPETLDDVLRAKETADATHASGDETNKNVTRDTEVSKLISPLEAAGGQVVIIRGKDRTVVQFGPNAGGADEPR